MSGTLKYLGYDRTHLPLHPPHSHVYLYCHICIDTISIFQKMIFNLLHGMHPDFLYPILASLAHSPLFHPNLLQTALFYCIFLNATCSLIK